MSSATSSPDSGFLVPACGRWPGAAHSRA